MRVEFYGGPWHGKVIELPEGTRKVEVAVATGRFVVVRGVLEPELAAICCEVDPSGRAIWPEDQPA